MPDEKEGKVLNPLLPPHLPRKDGPDFIGRLKGREVRILMHDEDDYTGKILKYNKYELLFLEYDDILCTYDTVPIVIMKNFIKMIMPLGDENPFEKKPDEVKPEVQA